MTDNYELLRDAYTGGGGFEDGRHLFMHSREEPEDYHLRKKMARYSNFVKVIIHSLTNPIFKKPSCVTSTTMKCSSNLLRTSMAAARH